MCLLLWVSLRLILSSFKDTTPADPDQRGSVGWVSSRKGKGRRFDSQLGHMPGFAGSVPGQGVYKRQLIDISLPVSPSLPFSLKINK